MKPSINEQYNNEFNIPPEIYDAYLEIVCEHQSNKKLVKTEIEFLADKYVQYKDIIYAILNNALAHIELHTGNHQEALQYAKEAYKLYPDNDVIRRKLATCNNEIAVIENIENGHGSALPHYQEAHRLAPEDDVIRKNLARCHNELGVIEFSGKRYDSALPHFKEAYRLNAFHLHKKNLIDVYTRLMSVSCSKDLQKTADYMVEAHLLCEDDRYLNTLLYYMTKDKIDRTRAYEAIGSRKEINWHDPTVDEYYYQEDETLIIELPNLKVLDIILKSSVCNIRIINFAAKLSSESIEFLEKNIHLWRSVSNISVCNNVLPEELKKNIITNTHLLEFCVVYGKYSSSIIQHLNIYAQPYSRLREAIQNKKTLLDFMNLPETTPKTLLAILNHPDACDVSITIATSDTTRKISEQLQVIAAPAAFLVLRLHLSLCAPSLPTELITTIFSHLHFENSMYDMCVLAADLKNCGKSMTDLVNLMIDNTKKGGILDEWAALQKT